MLVSWKCKRNAQLFILAICVLLLLKFQRYCRWKSHELIAKCMVDRIVDTTCYKAPFRNIDTFNYQKGKVRGGGSGRGGGGIGIGCKERENKTKQALRLGYMLVSRNCKSYSQLLTLEVYLFLLLCSKDTVGEKVKSEIHIHFVDHIEDSTCIWGYKHHLGI